MKHIKDIDIKNKNVILRLDLNVSIKDGIILDDMKIRKSLKTINYLLNNNAHILILSHLGKIKCKEDKEKNSLKIVAKRLEKLLEQEVYFIENPLDSNIQTHMIEHQICLLENTRYLDLDNKRESNCDLELAKYWASFGDVFVNDSFGTTHRRHASNYGISLYLETAYGFLIEDELKGLEPIINYQKKPFTVVMGGAKVDDKIALIEELLKDCDYLLVGGGIANTFLKAAGYEVGSSLYSESLLNNVKKLINNYSNKIIMPTDVVVEDNNINCVKVGDIPKTGIIKDIGEETIKYYNNILSHSETIFINGTMGIYENEDFKNGTKKIYDSLKSNKIIIAGGGDAVSSIHYFDLQDKFSYLSSGGGATLNYIATKKLECFEENI